MERLKTFGFGACDIAKYSPSKEKWKGSPKIVNVTIKFEEALKLNLALKSCLLELNKLNRSTKEGKSAGVNLSLRWELDRIVVSKGKI